MRKKAGVSDPSATMWTLTRARAFSINLENPLFMLSAYKRGGSCFVSIQIVLSVNPVPPTRIELIKALEAFGLDNAVSFQTNYK